MSIHISATVKDFLFYSHRSEGTSIGVQIDLKTKLTVNGVKTFQSILDLTAREIFQAINLFDN